MFPRAQPSVVLTVLLASAPALSVPAFCEEALRDIDAARRAGDATWERYQAIVQRLPLSATPITEDARRRASEEGDLTQAYDALFGALADGCRDVSARAATSSAQEELRAIFAADERFAGERTEPDAVDRLKERIGLWLEELLESQLMRRYAGASRVVYLGALALFLLFVSTRVWRARARARLTRPHVDDEARVRRRRRRAFAAWRAEADERLRAGEVRGALRAGQLALLARLGEVKAGAVTSARTGREIARALDARSRPIVEPPLLRFERAYFAGGADVDEATQFLADVDAAAAQLNEPPTEPPNERAAATPGRAG